MSDDMNENEIVMDEILSDGYLDIAGQTYCYRVVARDSDLRRISVWVRPANELWQQCCGQPIERLAMLAAIADLAGQRG